MPYLLLCGWSKSTTSPLLSTFLLLLALLPDGIRTEFSWSSSFSPPASTSNMPFSDIFIFIMISSPVSLACPHPFPLLFKITYSAAPWFAHPSPPNYFLPRKLPQAPVPTLPPSLLSREVSRHFKVIQKFICIPSKLIHCYWCSQCDLLYISETKYRLSDASLKTCTLSDRPCWYPQLLAISTLLPIARPNFLSLPFYTARSREREL